MDETNMVGSLEGFLAAKEVFGRWAKAGFGDDDFWDGSREFWCELYSEDQVRELERISGKRQTPTDGGIGGDSVKEWDAAEVQAWAINFLSEGVRTPRFKHLSLEYKNQFQLKVRKLRDHAFDSTNLEKIRELDRLIEEEKRGHLKIVE